MIPGFNNAMTDKITPEVCDAMRTDLEEAFKAIEEKHGVGLKLGSMSYSADKFTARLTCSAGGAGNPYASEAADYKRYYGDSDRYLQLGDTFTSNGDTVTIVGCKPKSRKYPILGTKANGSCYKFPECKVLKEQKVAA